MSIQNSINKVNPNILPIGNYNAASGDYIIIADTSTSSPTITLPSSPVVGQVYRVLDGSGNASVHPVFFNGNGHTINGNSTVQPSSITLGSNNRDVAITPDGQYAYVTNTSNTVSVISNASSNPTFLKTITVGNNPTGVAITPDGGRAYVCNSSDNTVSIIPSASSGGGTPTTLVVGGMGTNPLYIAITPDGTFAYTTNYGFGGAGNTVSIIDNVSIGTPGLAGTITVGTGPDGIAITPNGQYAYVCNNGANTVSIIPNASSGGGTAATFNVDGVHPINLAITSDGNSAYVVNQSSNNVSIISGASTSSPFTMFSALTVGSNPRGIAISPDGKKVYVGNITDGTISVISGLSSTPFVTPYKITSNSTYNMTITPNGQYLYGVDPTSAILQILNTNIVSINQNYGELQFIYTGSKWIAS